MSRRRPSHTTFQPRACTRDSLTIQQSKSNVLLSTTSCRHIRTRPTRSLIRIGDCRNLSEKTTRRMAIANGTCVSFCNQPNAQFAYLRGVTPVCHCLHPFCEWRHFATERESNAAFTPAQLVVRNKLRATRNLLRATSIKLRAICCAQQVALV